MYKYMCYPNFEQIPFDYKCYRDYAVIKPSLQKKGAPIEPMDLLIVSISLTRQFTLITNNLKEFKRVHPVKSVKPRFTLLSVKYRKVRFEISIFPILFNRVNPVKYIYFI